MVTSERALVHRQRVPIERFCLSRAVESHEVRREARFRARRVMVVGTIHGLEQLRRLAEVWLSIRAPVEALKHRGVVSDAARERCVWAREEPPPTLEDLGEERLRGGVSAHAE